MNSIRRMLLGGLAALVGGPALAQAPAPRDNPPSTAPTAKAIDATIDPVSGAIMVTQGRKAQWKPVLPAGKQIIKIEPSDRNGVLVESSDTDPNTLVFTGLRIGVYKLYITVGANQNDPQALTREFEVVVQPDFEVLRRAFARAVPTASIEIIPGPGNTIILAGYVNKPEDAETVMMIARAATITSSTTTSTTGSSTTTPTNPGGGTTTPNYGGGTVGGGTVTNNYNGSVAPSTTQASAVSTQAVQVGTIINAIQVGGLQHVQIEVVFASVNRTKTRSRGANLAFNGSQGSFISNMLGSSAANLTVSVVPANIFVALNALKSEGLAKLLSEPKIVTQSGRSASLYSGGQQAVLSSTGGAQSGSSVTLERVGTTLDVIPIVYGNGKIYLELNPRNRSVNSGLGISVASNGGGGVTFSPGFSEQSVNASVMLESGQTFAIGGLLETSMQSNINKIPVLGEVPYVGALFSNRTTTENETELIVLVTPRLVDAMDCNQTPKRMPGQESRTPDDYEFYLESFLEAPRGQRQVWNGRCYNAPWKCDPRGAFPCKNNVCGAGCANGTAPTSLPATSAPAKAVVTPINPTAVPVAAPTAPSPLPTAAPSEPIVMPQVTPAPVTAPQTPETPVTAPVAPEAPVTAPEPTPGPVTPSDVPAPAPATPPSGN